MANSPTNKKVKYKEIEEGRIVTYFNVPGKISNEDRLKKDNPKYEETLKQQEIANLIFKRDIFNHSIALSNCSAVILCRFMTELASLSASMLDTVGAHLNQAAKIFLLRLWISVEDQTPSNSAFIIAKGSDSLQFRTSEVTKTLENILQSDGVASKDVTEWLSLLDCFKSPSINKNAVLIDRRSMARALPRNLNKKSCDTDGALDIISNYFNGFANIVESYFYKDDIPVTSESAEESEIVDNQDSIFKRTNITIVSNNLFTDRFGTGESAKFDVLSSIYLALSEWASEALNNLSSNSNEKEKNYTTDGLINHLFGKFNFLPSGCNAETYTPENFMSLMKRKTHNSATLSALSTLFNTPQDAISSDDLEKIKKSSVKDAKRCQEKFQNKKPMAYLTDIMDAAAKNCGVPFERKGKTRAFYTDAICQAMERLVSHILSSAAQECKRQKFVKLGNKDIETVNDETVKYVDHCCDKRKLETKSNHPILINKKEIHYYNDLYDRWKKNNCFTVDMRQGEVLEFLNKTKITHNFDHNFFYNLCGIDALPGENFANFDPLEHLTPENFSNFASSRKNLSDSLNHNAPMLRHFDAYNSPATMIFGSGFLDITYGDKRKRDVYDLQNFSIYLWDGSRWVNHSKKIESKRIIQALALTSCGNGPKVTVATPLGRLACELNKDEQCHLDGECNRTNHLPTIISCKPEDLIKLRDSQPNPGEDEGKFLNALKETNWYVDLKVKVKSNGPYYNWVENNNIPVHYSGGPPKYSDNDSRGTAVRQKLCQLPPNTIIIGVDCGIRFALVASIVETLSKEEMESICHKNGSDIPEEKDLYWHIKANNNNNNERTKYKNSSGSRTIIFRRIGPDFLPDGKPYPAPWAMLISQFALKVPGEFEGDKRELSVDEMVYIHKMESLLGVSTPYVSRLILSGFGKTEKQGKSLKELRGIITDLPTSSEELPNIYTKKELSRDAITAFNNLSVCSRLSIKDLLSLRRILELLKSDSTPDKQNKLDKTSALFKWWKLRDSDNAIGNFALKLWEKYVATCPDYKDPLAESYDKNQPSTEENDSKTATRVTSTLFKKNFLSDKIISWLSDPERLNELCDTLNNFIQLHNQNIDFIINGINNFLFHYDSFANESLDKQQASVDIISLKELDELAEKHKWSKKELDEKKLAVQQFSIRNLSGRKMGGLSLERIDTLEYFIYKVLRPFKRHLYECSEKEVDQEFDVTKIGAKEIASLGKIREDRDKKLANLLIHVTLGGSPDKYDSRHKKETVVSVKSKASPILVLENLSSLIPSLENTRRQNRMISKLKASCLKKYVQQMCDRHGILLYQVSPRETSTIDSRTGHFGERGMYVSAEEFVKTKWIQNEIQKRKDKSKTNGTTESLKTLIDLHDSLKKLLPHQLRKQKPVFFPCKGGNLFISASPDGDWIINADFNASFNIALRPIIDPDWPGAHYKICVNTNGEPNKNNYKGSKTIPKEKIVDYEIKPPKNKKQKELFNLWRFLSTKPIDVQSTWFLYHDFFDMIRSLVDEKLSKIITPRIDRLNCNSGASP
jgi:hypothetical protein